MYFSKITLRKNSGSLDKIKSYTNENGYTYHQLIWNLFSENNPDKKRDYIYRSDFDNMWPNFIAISKTYPIDQDGLWEINTKSYQPVIKNGENLYFILRVNPRVFCGNGIYKNKYIDIIQQAFYNFRNTKRKSKSEIIQSVGIDWISQRNKRNGFTINEKNTIVDKFEKHIVNKLKQKDYISFSAIDFRGQLKVNDSEKFIHTLHNGIGAAKAFGCGLLLIRR